MLTPPSLLILGPGILVSSIDLSLNNTEAILRVGVVSFHLLYFASKRQFHDAMTFSAVTVRKSIS